MQYLGGKTRIATHISEVLSTFSETRSTYVEPFLGGGSVAALTAPRFSRAIVADVVPDLVMLWQAAISGWTPPDDITEQEWAALRKAEPSALRGFAGFACSFGGKWFAGYARDPRKRLTFAQTGGRGLLRKAECLANAEIRQADYHELAYLAGPDSVVYCDPPYAGTTGYGAVGGFDSREFWAEMSKWSSAGAAVFVSEYTAPPGWVSVWSSNPRMTVARGDNVSRAAEFLFTSPEIAAQLSAEIPALT